MIRKAEKQDLPRVAEIIVFGKRVTYRPIFQNDQVSFNELQVISELQLLEENLLKTDMLLYDDGIIKGVINRQYVDDRVEICEFYVEPFFKGKGIGRKLISHVINQAKQEGKSGIFLWVLSDNTDARRFYEKNGFRMNGQTTIFEGTDKLDLCYEMEIQ